MENQLENWSFNPMFSPTSATSSSLHIVFLTVTDENHKRCIFPILPLNAPRSFKFEE